MCNVAQNPPSGPRPRRDERICRQVSSEEVEPDETYVSCIYVCK